jgi:iron-sulfur cluster repair protein YtfE (RIC family)
MCRNCHGVGVGWSEFCCVQRYPLKRQIQKTDLTTFQKLSNLNQMKLLEFAGAHSNLRGLSLVTRFIIVYHHETLRFMARSGR